METVVDRVQIFDTTLRDGEQSPGATMNVGEKVTVALQLERLGVDVIEAGFAASSEGDFAAVQRVAETVERPIVLSLARTRGPDIERAVRACAGARRPGIHVFIATSDIHLEHKLQMTRQEVLDAAVWAVQRARESVDYVEFSAEDASRSDRDFLVQVFSEVIRAGASTVNVPDTTGYAMPEEFGALFRYLIEQTADADKAIWSAHCHNDLGLAVANSLAAVRNGARQIECTVNGIGERAGNTALEEVVMAIKTRRDSFPAVDTGIVTEQIYPSSRLVSQVTGIAVPINKPVVGDNAFAHEAGIHQDGVLKNKITYEIMRPETVGIASNRLVLGKHSGRHAFVDRLTELRIDLARVDMNEAFDRFKALCDKKKEIYDEDLLAIVAEGHGHGADRYELTFLRVNSSTGELPRAEVRMRVDGTEHSGEATGDGIVDACYKVIKDIMGRVIGEVPRLERYSVKAITGGTEAQGEVSCLVRSEALTAMGHGVHTDVIMASTLAFINALNKLEYRRRFPQEIVRHGP
jgi:2-isopropylmalate synthase